MTEPINIPVQAPGAADLSRVIAQLSGSVSQLAENINQSATAERSDTDATQANTQAKSANAQAALAFGQRIAGVANAVQSLVSQMGGTNHTAGLIGALANSTVQFAQMGAALGPEGAVVGGIVGALIPALQQLIQVQDAAADSARQHAQAERDLAEAAAGATDLRIRNGAGTDHEIAVATQAQMVAIQELQATMADLNTVRSGNAASIASYARGIAYQIQHGDSTDHLIDQMQERIAGAQREIDRLQSTTGTSDTTGLAALGPGHEVAIAHPTAAPAHHAGGSGPSPEEAETARLLALLQQTNETRQLGQQIADAYHTESQEGTKAETEAERAYQAEIRRTDRLRAEADQHRHKEIQNALREEEQTKNKLRQEAQQRTQEGEQATSAIIGNLTNVFTLMAAGQANAAQGAELLLAGFLQYISQRATIEALAQVAQGIGSYPDFGGMALHFAAAAAWAAVAVATGVGGAALASDAQGKASTAAASASQPASPQGGGDNGKSGGNTIIVQFNSPVITAATTAQLARPIRRMIEQSAQRFPGG